jgi:hypothetical protein
VHPRERLLEDGAEVGGAARGVLGDLLERLRDGVGGGVGEALGRVEDGGGDVGAHDGEAVAGREAAQQRLGDRELGLLLGRVAGGRGVDDDDDLAGGHRHLREVEVGGVADHDEAGLVAAGVEQVVAQRGVRGAPVGLAGQLDLEVGARGVAGAAHGDALVVLLDARLAEGGEGVALLEAAAQLDLERELLDAVAASRPGGPDSG